MLQLSFHSDKIINISIKQGRRPIGMKAVVLIVDDDAGIVEVCRRYLADRGYAVLWAGSGEEALNVLTGHRVDVILLDVMLPDTEGFDLVEHVRKSFGGSEAEIVFLTARDAPADRVRGLNLGSEYLTKPFELEELSLRLAMLRRRGEQRNRIVVPPLELDCVRQRVTLDGEVVPLTASEFRLLARLAETPGVPVSYAALSRLLWPGEPVRLHALMNHVSSIRRRLDTEARRGVRITGERGFGYTLSCGKEPPGERP